MAEADWEEFNKRMAEPNGAAATTEDIEQILLQRLEGCREATVVAEYEHEVHVRVLGNWGLNECGDVEVRAISLLREVAPVHVRFKVTAAPWEMWQSGAYQAMEQARAVTAAVGEMQWLAAYEMLRELQVHIIARMEDRGDLKAAVQRQPGALSAKEEILVARPVLDVVKAGRAVKLIRAPILDVDYVGNPGGESPVYLRMGRTVYECTLTHMEGVVMSEIRLALQVLREVDKDLPYSEERDDG